MTATTARADFGLADVFGIHKAGDVVGTNGNAYMAPHRGPPSDSRWLRRHTPLIPGAEYRVPLAPVDGSPLTVVPGYVAYPPELSYPEPSTTSEPAMVVARAAGSRIVFFPGDVDRTAWRSGHPTCRGCCRTRSAGSPVRSAPATIEGDGVDRAFAWETEAGFALHVLNYTNPAMHRGWIRAFYPIGPQRVRFTVPPSARVSRVSLLQAGVDVPFQRAGRRGHLHDPQGGRLRGRGHRLRTRARMPPTATSRNLVSNPPQRTMRYQGHARGRVALVSAWAACSMLAAGTAAAQSAVQSADRELAWQAWIAGRDHITSAQPMLEGIVEDRIDAEPYAPAVDFALDALIQLHAPLRPELLGRVAVRRPVEALVFLAREPGMAGDAVLLSLLERRHGYEWFAAANLLLQRAPPGFTAQLLTGLRIVAWLTLSDEGHALAGGAGEGGGIACGVMGTAPGMPPWPWYRLADVGDGRPLLAGGPRPIYLERTVMPAGTPPYRGGPLMAGPTAADRLRYVSALAGPQDLLSASERRGARAYPGFDIGRARDEFRDDLLARHAALVRDLVVAGHLTANEAADLTLDIDMRVTDLRSTP